MSGTTRRTTGLLAFGGVLALLVGVGCSGSQPAKEACLRAWAAGQLRPAGETLLADLAQPEVEVRAGA